MKVSWIKLSVSAAIVSLVSISCSTVGTRTAPQEVTVGECTKICDASGAWVFESLQDKYIGDIWMEPEGIYVRNRQTEDVRFYRAVAVDQYLHDDGELLEFMNDDLMIRHLASGEEVTQTRATS